MTNLNTFNDEELSYINYSVSVSLKELMSRVDDGWSMEDKVMYVTLSTLKAKVEAIQQVMRSINTQKVVTPYIQRLHTPSSVPPTDKTHDVLNNEKQESYMTVDPNVYVPDNTVSETPEPVERPSYDNAVSDTGIKEKITIKKVGNK